MSIGKLVLDGPLLNAADESDAVATLRELVREKARAIERSVSQPPRIVGMLYHAITPTFLRDRKILGLAQQVYGRNLAKKGSRDWRTVEALKDRLGGVVR